MFRIDSSTAASSKPAYPAAGTEKYFQDTDPSGGTIVPAWFLNQVQEEIRKVITDAGLTPDKANDGQLSAAISVLAGNKTMKYSGATAFTGSMPTSYADLDLSGTIGVRRCFVHLQILPDASVNVSFRPNGESKEIGVDVAGVPTGTSGGATTASTTSTVYLSLITDDSGVVEWKASEAGSGASTVKLLTYQVLG